MMFSPRLALLLLLAPASALPAMSGRELAEVKKPEAKIGQQTQIATGVKVATGMATGLPGITPAKKAVASTSTSTPVSPGAYTNFRSALQKTICTQGTAEDKVRLLVFKRLVSLRTCTAR